MKESYTIEELSEELNVSTMTITRHLKGLVLKEKNKIIVPLDVVKLLQVRHKYDSNLESDDVFDIVEGFSSDEYQEFQKRLIEYPILKEQIEYHRKSAESHQRQMETILRVIEQKNYIEVANKINEKTAKK